MSVHFITGVALGAGLLFGLITMLVQYVGLFMTGFHTGLFAGVVALATAEQFRWQPATVWTSAAVLLGSGLLAAVLNLYWQKGESTCGTEFCLRVISLTSKIQGHYFI